MVRIIYYRNKCIGCNACVEAAPERWRVSKKDGRCTLIGAKEKKGVFQLLVNESEFEKNSMAAANCPQKIIRLDRV